MQPESRDFSIRLGSVLMISFNSLLSWSLISRLTLQLSIMPLCHSSYVVTFKLAILPDTIRNTTRYYPIRVFRITRVCLTRYHNKKFLGLEFLAATNLDNYGMNFAISKIIWSETLLVFFKLSHSAAYFQFVDESPSPFKGMS